MRKLISILCIAFVCIFLAAGRSWSEKNIYQEKSAGEKPLQLEQSNGNIEKKGPIVKAEELKKEETNDGKIAYITIDDGPSRNNTTANLDTLKENDIKATFFVLPKSNLDDIYKRIIDEGHVIGNHSYSHSKHLYASVEDFEKDVLKAKAFIYKKFNYTTTVFRFPGGTMGRKKSIIQKRADILKKYGYRYFDWNVSVADTDPNIKSYGDEKFIINLMINNVVNNTKDRKRLIVLMHDDSTKTYTAKALPSIIKGLKKQGYTFDVLTNYKDT